MKTSAIILIVFAMTSLAACKASNDSAPSSKKSASPAAPKERTVTPPTGTPAPSVATKSDQPVPSQSPDETPQYDPKADSLDTVFAEGKFAIKDVATSEKKACADAGMRLPTSREMASLMIIRSGAEILESTYPNIGISEEVVQREIAERKLEDYEPVFTQKNGGAITVDFYIRLRSGYVTYRQLDIPGNVTALTSTRIIMKSPESWKAGQYLQTFYGFGAADSEFNMVITSGSFPVFDMVQIHPGHVLCIPKTISLPSLKPRKCYATDQVIEAAQDYVTTQKGYSSCKGGRPTIAFDSRPNVEAFDLQVTCKDQSPVKVRTYMMQAYEGSQNCTLLGNDFVN